MVKHNIECDDSRLTVLLTGDERSDEFRRCAAHLELCDRCQTRLTALVADSETWNDVAESLREDEHIVSNPSVESRLDFLAPPSHPELLGQLGRYEIESVIGAGGMGIVLKAHDSELNRPVAIKVLAPHLAHNDTARQRFTREGRAAAAVVHEHVMAIHNVESDADHPFLVMQYVSGKSLQLRLDEHDPLDVKEILRIGAQAAEGLAAAHAQGVVHRDIKPSNILLENGVERVVLSDFGLARAVDDSSVTRQGILTGTPEYMSPEQAKGEAIDHRSDLFSLGSVLYAMCTGHTPFRAATTLGVLRRIADDTPENIREINSEIPDWLETIVEKLLAKDPAERFQTAEEVCELLGEWLAHLQAPALQPRPRNPARSRTPHRRAPAGKQFLPGWFWLTALSVISIVIVSFSVIFVRLGETTLRIEIDDPSLSIRFGDQEITFDSDGRKIYITPSEERQFIVKQDGEEVERRAFELKKGQKVVLRVAVVDGRVDVSGDEEVHWLPVREVPQKSPLLNEIATLTGHTNPVYTLVFSPDSKTLATAGNDMWIILWDVATGSKKNAFKGHSKGVRFITYNADGTLLASAGADGRIVLWDVSTGEKVLTLTGHEGPVSCVAFSPDGKLLASVGDDRTVRLWETTNGDEISVLKGHNGAIWSVAFSPDGRTLVSGSDDMTTWLWDVATGQVIGELKVHRGSVRALAFNSTGSVLATGSFDNTINLWNFAAARKSPPSEPLPFATLKGHTEPVVSLSFSPDDKTLASGSWDGTFALWDVASGQRKATFRAHKNFVWSVAFSPDGKTFASASRDHTVKLWREATAGKIAARRELDAAVTFIEQNLRGRASIDPQHPEAIRVVLSGDHITDDALQYLHGLTSVSELVFVPETRVTDAGLNHLTGLKNLQRLSLKQSSIGDSGLKHLNGLTGLKELDLSRSQVTDAGLKHLEELTNLEVLNLTGLPITDAGLEHLKSLRKLKTLSLSGTQVSDAGLVHLNGLNNLENLYLGGTQISDEGLEQLKASSNLDKLYLESTQVTDAGLLMLFGMSDLRFLNVLRTHVTNAGVSHLQAKLPRCFIAK